MQKIQRKSGKKMFSDDKTLLFEAFANYLPFTAMRTGLQSGINILQKEHPFVMGRIPGF